MSTYYWTIRQNWNGHLWPRLWPNKKFAWKAIQEETGYTRKQVQANCDWTLVRVRLVEAKP